MPRVFSAAGGVAQAVAFGACRVTAALERVFDRQPAGVLAVLDAANIAHHRLSDAQWVASFAPPITSYRSCVCGRTYEKRGSDQINVTAAEKSAAAEAVADMLGRAALDIDHSVVARVIDAINHERAVADADEDRDWYDAHADCEVDL